MTTPPAAATPTPWPCTSRASRRANFTRSASSSSAEGTDGLRVSTDWGYAGVLSVGYGFGNGLRVELEGSYRQNDASQFGAQGDVFGVPYNFNYERVSGQVRSYGVMVNAFYDIPVGPVVPYVGVGAGYVWHNYPTRLLILTLAMVTLTASSYAVLLPVWDILFGTANFERRYDATGIRDQIEQGRDYGRGFWAQQWLGLKRLAGADKPRNNKT